MTSLFLGAGRRDGEADIEERGASFEVYAKGGIEIPYEFSPCCACAEILNRVAVLLEELDAGVAVIAPWLRTLESVS